MLRGLATIKVCICTYGEEVEKDVKRSGGVRVVWPSSRPTLATLDVLRALRPSTDATVPYTPVHALSSTLELILSREHGEPSPSWTRVVYFATRPESPHDADADAFRAQLIDSNTALRILAYGPASQVYSSTNAFWQRVIQDVHGSGIASPHEAYEEAQAPSLQLPTSNPAKSVLSFGEVHAPDKASLEIPVQIVKATALQRMHAPRRILKADASGEADSDKMGNRLIDTKHMLYRAEDVARAGDELSKVSPLPEEISSSVQRAYKLGASIVPFAHPPSPIPTTAGLEILHFVSAATYKREFHVGETYMVIAAPTSKSAQIALSSLVQAASMRSVYVLCRLVTRTHADPKLCMLAPMIENEYDAFYLVHVPFRDDVKRFAFPPLDRVTTSTGEITYEHATIPTKEQQDKMDAFVDRMDLMDMDSHGHPDGWYDPPLCFHPAIHGLKHSIKWRFLHPHDALPPLQSRLTEFLHVPAQVERRARPARDACAAAFGVHRSANTRPSTNLTPSKQPKREASEDEVDTETESDTTDAWPSASISSVRAGSAGTIHTDSAVHDFEALIKMQAVSEACEAMSKAVLVLAARRADIHVILPAIEVYRRTAADLDEALTYNA